MSLDLDILGGVDVMSLDRLVEENIDRVERQRVPTSVKTGKSLTFITPIQNLTPKHHAIARLIADGLRDTDVAAMTGYTVVRVYQLKNDPMFKDLVDFYLSEVSAKFKDTIEMRRRVGVLAMDRLTEKLLDDEIGPTLSAKSLTEIAEFALGKAGDNGNSNGNSVAGPVQVNITFGKGQEAKETLPSVTTIDLEANKTTEGL